MAWVVGKNRHIGEWSSGGSETEYPIKNWWVFRVHAMDRDEAEEKAKLEYKNLAKQWGYVPGEPTPARIDLLLAIESGSLKVRDAGYGYTLGGTGMSHHRAALDWASSNGLIRTPEFTGTRGQFQTLTVEFNDAGRQLLADWREEPVLAGVVEPI